MTNESPRVGVPTIPDLQQSGTSLNITWYVASGWYVEVICNQRDHASPTYSFRVHKIDRRRRVSPPVAVFSYKPGTPGTSRTRLPDETVTSQVRLHFEAGTINDKKEK